MLTTHYMEEAEQLCDRLVVMDKGHIIANGSPLELITTYVTREAEVQSSRSEYLERCESGRIGLTANELTRETLSEGSNPSLSAHI